MTGGVYVGVGGWTYDRWRGTFYPPKLPHARELEHAASRLTAIEINGTYYRLQKRESFAAWAKATPPGFVFAVKGSRYCTNRTVLAQAGESIAKFLGQGLTELGDKLGPVLWQFAPTKRFDAADFGAFLKLLPASQSGVALRHAVEVRHESFRNPAFVDLARAAAVAIVFADSAEYPSFADLTADFVYARLQRTREDAPTGYDAAELDRWAAVAKTWAAGGVPQALPYVAPGSAVAAKREVFIFMISGAKVRAPAAAMALIERLRRKSRGRNPKLG